MATDRLCCYIVRSTILFSNPTADGIIDGLVLAKYCLKCGKEIADDIRYCPNCGTTTSQRELDLETKIKQQSQKDSPTWLTKTNVIFIAVILVVVGAGLYFVDNLGNSSELTITVVSTHVTEDVDIVIYVDGEEFTHYNGLEPGHSCKYTGDFRYSGFDTSKLIEIKAVSVGGGLGSQADTESIIIEPRGSYAVTLYV